MSSEAIYLGVNIDHVATIRQARGTRYPEPIQAALVAEHAGADSITMHLREDRRHIIDRDVESMVGVLQSKMNLEMAVTDEMVEIACRMAPADCCLVPEKREELTTEGGLDVISQQQKLADVCTQLNESGVRVSLFIDADEHQIESAKKTGAPVIEIHTGHYADAKTAELKEIELKKIKVAVSLAHEMGLQVNAGHGLDYHCVADIAKIPEIIELNIGHSIIARSIFCGLADAVKDMKNLMLQARQLSS